MSQVWRIGGRFEKRYSVLWPWVPLLGLLKGNVPQLDARREARNAERLRALGIEAPRVAGTRARWRIAPLGLVHETVVALEPLAGEPLDRWLPAAAPADRRAVARLAGDLVRRMHEAAIFHRDLYLCHLLWDGRRLGVLDVARASPRFLLRERWRVKDLAALELSAAEIGLGARERITFLREYFGRDSRIDRAQLERIRRKARRMAKHGKKG